MAVSKTCDVCKFAKQKIDPATRQMVPDVLRYTLRRETDQRRENGTRTGRYQMSAGGIDLCGECWTRICKPHMNPKMSRKPKSMFLPSA